MTDFISELYPKALDVGISPQDFWGYTIQEIKDVIESYNRNYRNKERQGVVNNYILSKMLSHQVALMFDKNGEEIPFWKFAPHLFEDFKKEEDERIKLMQLELHKERMREFAMRFNLLRKEEK